MSVTDYVIDILLILADFCEVRPHELTPRVVLLPIALSRRRGSSTCGRSRCAATTWP